MRDEFEHAAVHAARLVGLAEGGEDTEPHVAAELGGGPLEGGGLPEQHAVVVDAGRARLRRGGRGRDGSGRGRGVPVPAAEAGDAEERGREGGERRAPEPPHARPSPHLTLRVTILRWLRPDSRS